MSKFFQSKGFIWGLSILIIVGAIVGYYWFKTANSTIRIDLAALSAPEVDLTSPQSGTLNAVYANEGDMVAVNTPVARVGNALIKTNSAGKIVTINGGVGRSVNMGETVVILIDPSTLQVVGQLAENQNLKDIQVGQNVYFTVDAFGSQRFYGTVSEVGSTADTSNIAFQSSGTRQIQNFDVKVQFDAIQFPQLKNGMSARIWVIK